MIGKAQTPHTQVAAILEGTPQISEENGFSVSKMVREQYTYLIQ